MSKSLRASASALAVSVVFLCLGQPLRAQQGFAPFGTNNGQSGSTQATPTPVPSQLDLLKADYQRQEQALVKPIRDNYLLALTALMKSLTQNRNLDEALTVQEELKSTQAQPAPSFVDQIGGAAGPAPGAPSQLDSLKSKYHSDLRTAILPIQQRYIAVLNNLLNAATQSGNLDEALAVRDELKNAAIAQPSGPAGAGSNGGQSPAAAGPGWYYVQANVSGLYLHVVAGNHNVGGHVDQARKSEDQVWKFIPDGKGNYFIQSKISELFLDPKPTADDWMDQVNRAPDVVWQLIPDGNGNYFIKSPNTGNNLDVWAAHTDVGGKVHQAAQDTKQVWKLIPLNEGL